MRVNWNNLPEETVEFRVKWLAVYTFALIALVVFLCKTDFKEVDQPVLITPTTASVPTPQAEPSLSDLIKDWKYPNAFSLGGSSGGALQEAYSTTTEPYRKVWEYYARKCGYTQGYAPVMISAGQSGSDTAYSLHSEDQPDTKIASFLLNTDHHTLVATIWKGNLDANTHLMLVVGTRNKAN